MIARAIGFALLLIAAIGLAYIAYLYIQRANDLIAAQKAWDWTLTYAVASLFITGTLITTFGSMLIEARETNRLLAGMNARMDAQRVFPNQ